MRDPIHPGETLREDLDVLEMSAAELARRIEVPVNRITEILNGRRAVTGDTALRLGRFFGTSGEFWLNLQKIYELRLAERKNGADDCPPSDPGSRQGAARHAMSVGRWPAGGAGRSGADECQVVTPASLACRSGSGTRQERDG